MSPTRRSFLGTRGGLAAGYALAPALRAAESSGKPLGLALCGLGNYSNGELSPALLETKNVKLVAVITGTRVPWRVVDVTLEVAARGLSLPLSRELCVVSPSDGRHE